MRTVTVKKIVGVCFHDAVKLTIDQLGACRLAQDEAGQPVPSKFLQCYAGCRRLREYLQSALRAAHNEVRLDLPRDECATLVASCRRYVDWLDTQVRATPHGKERQFLERKSEVLGDWAVELAAPPLLEIPLLQRESRIGEGSGSLTRRILDRVQSEEARRLIRGGDVQALGDMAMGATSAAPHRTGRPSPRTDGWDIFGQSSAATDEAPCATKVAALLVDASVLREPRLRSLLALDLRSLGAAEEAGDYRIATMLLAAVLETAVIDYALPRRSQFGLEGAPDTWCPQRILQQALAGQGRSGDIAHAGQLFAARDMLRPGRQLQSPSVANAVSEQRARDLVAEVLFMLGYRHGPDVE